MDQRTIDSLLKNSGRMQSQNRAPNRASSTFRWLRTQSGRWTSSVLRRISSTSQSSTNPLFSHPPMSLGSDGGDVSTQEEAEGFNRSRASSTRLSEAEWALAEDYKADIRFWPCPQGHVMHLYEFGEAIICDHCFRQPMYGYHCLACPTCNYFVCLNRCYASFFVFPKWFQLLNELETHILEQTFQESWADLLLEVAEKCKRRQGIAKALPVSLGVLLGDGLSYSMLYNEPVFDFLMDKVYCNKELVVTRQGQNVVLASESILNIALSEAFALACAMGERLASERVKQQIRSVFNDTDRIDPMVHQSWGFHLACINGHLDTVKLLMTHPKSATFTIPWISIASEDQLEVFLYLSELKGENLLPENYETYFDYAACNGAVRLVDYFLTSHHAPFPADTIARAFRNAVSNCHDKVVTRLLDEDSLDVNETLSEYSFQVILPNFDKVIKAIVDKSSNFATENLLLDVISSGNSTALRYVLDSVENPLDLVSPMMVINACSSGSLEMIKTLSEYRSFDLLSSYDKVVALDSAVKTGDLQVVKYLILNHIPQDVHETSRFEVLNSFIAALLRNYYEIAKYLHENVGIPSVDRIELENQVGIVVGSCSPGHEVYGLQVVEHWHRVSQDVGLAQLNVAFFHFIEKPSISTVPDLVWHSARRNCPSILDRLLKLEKLIVPQHVLFDAMDYAVQEGHLECFKLIQNDSRCPVYPPIALQNATLTAASGGFSNMVEYLLSMSEENETHGGPGGTHSLALIRAAIGGHWKTVTWLMQQPETNPMAHFCAALRSSSLRAVLTACNAQPSIGQGTFSEALVQSQGIDTLGNDVFSNFECSHAEKNFRELYESFPWLTRVKIRDNSQDNPHMTVCRLLIADEKLPYHTLSYKHDLVTVQHVLLDQHQESRVMGVWCLLESASQAGLSIVPWEIVNIIVGKMCPSWLLWDQEDEDFEDPDISESFFV